MDRSYTSGRIRTAGKASWGPISPTATFPCSVFIDWVRVYQLGWPASADEGENETIFQIYPNPAQDLIQIQVRNPEDYTIRIADLSGKTVIHTTLDTSSSVDVSTLKDGIYLVVANNGDLTLSKRIIIQ